jgi:NarL family two-component system response regulator YdfI
LSLAVNMRDERRSAALSARPTRVLIGAESPTVRSALEGMLESETEIQIVGQFGRPAELPAAASVDPDVVLWNASSEHFSQAEGLFATGLPIVVIVEQPGPDWIRHLLGGNIRVLLCGTPNSSELAAAIQSAAAGLVTISPKLTAFLGPSSSAETALEDDELYPEHLTAREREVLEMMMEGLSNKEIAVSLNVSTHTVKFHISSVLAKLGASSRTEATTIGLRRGLITI